MKKALLFSLLVASLLSCKKNHDCDTIPVTVNFLTSGVTLIFTGDQGQGSYTITPGSPMQHLPNTGTYTVCIDGWNGGCPVFARDSDEQVADAYNSICGQGLVLESNYDVYHQCE